MRERDNAKSNLRGEDLEEPGLIAGEPPLPGRREHFRAGR